MRPNTDFVGLFYSLTMRNNITELLIAQKSKEMLKKKIKFFLLKSFYRFELKVVSNMFGTDTYVFDLKPISWRLRLLTTILSPLILVLCAVVGVTLLPVVVFKHLLVSDDLYKPEEIVHVKVRKGERRVPTSNDAFEELKERL